MKISKIAFLVCIGAPFAAFATNEGVPAYYQKTAAPNANQMSYGEYQAQGYTKYVGQSGNKQIVGTNTYSYQVPRQTMPTFSGTMTANGIAMPSEHNTSIYAGYARRFADFEFKTGVNSVLEWDDMVFNEIEVGARHDFSLRNFDMFAFAQYSHGWLGHGGYSMDYDLEAFDQSDPTYGIFTVSVGQENGETNHLKFGLGARHIWDIGGWKLSPVIGYEIFKHDLEMSDHLYPNPGIYLPLMTSQGDYVVGDEYGNFFTFPTGIDIPNEYYQVCMSPEDIKVVDTALYGMLTSLGTSVTSVDYNPATMNSLNIWGVGENDCVIIGGDGEVMVAGTTHIYNTTWSGFYIGLEIEKQMTLNDKLRFYAQFGLPKYSSEGIWPNRDDWQQSPSFIDEGDNGAYSYAAELEYSLRLSDRLQLALKVDTNYFHVGNIGGELYIASYSQYQVDENGFLIYEEVDLNGDNVFDVYMPIMQEVSAHTEHVSDSLKHASWQSFGLHLGFKYAF